MTYSHKTRARAAARRKARDKKLKRERVAGESAKFGPRSRAGNAPNVASLTAAHRNPKRKEVLKFVGAISRGARVRRALIDAIAKADSVEGKAVRSKLSGQSGPTDGPQAAAP